MFSSIRQPLWRLGPRVIDKRDAASLRLAAAAVGVLSLVLAGCSPTVAVKPSSDAPSATIQNAASPPNPPGTVATSASPGGTPIPEPTRAPGVTLGAYIPGAPSDPSQIDAYAALTGAMPHVVMWFQAWAGDGAPFYFKGADEIRSRGAVPMVSWEPWVGNTSDPDWSLQTIIDGSHDSYIHSWTHDAATWGHPIYVRLMYEMNGNWTAWSASVNGNTPSEYVAAWRHIVEIGRAEGGSNIRWLWCPNVDGSLTFTPYPSIYPGDAYVDWVGLTGYNYGTSQSWSSWQSLYDVFKHSYDLIGTVSKQPLMIVETGSSEDGGNKAAWITDGFADLLTKFPNVQALTWYDVDHRQTDWRVNSSAESLKAFQAVATSSAFAGTLP